MNTSIISIPNIISEMVEYVQVTRVKGRLTTAKRKMKTVKTIGINSNQPVGRGFNFPYDIAINDDLGKSRIIYLLNRPNSATRLGTRIQYFTFE